MKARNLTALYIPAPLAIAIGIYTHEQEIRIIQAIPSGKVRTAVTQVPIAFSIRMFPLTAFEVKPENSLMMLICDFPGEMGLVDTTTLNHFFNDTVPSSNFSFAKKCPGVPSW